MIIQLNIDKNTDGDERLQSYLNTIIKDELSNFSDNITRIEVHLSDENSLKNEEHDNRCMLEARLENRQSITVTSNANTVETAVNDALKKLKVSLDTIEWRLKNIEINLAITTKAMISFLFGMKSEPIKI
ncbi:HPF/RaiA family ribosome-associated protein [Algibacter sp. L4_22]|uniref:HPF/RaiA family ribosome-associated protein n=1 Tax=Algibacter sp. L4_22 TaxID=2942477 RepID=UPI00201B6055|nr:HPF/RaiA family ribosome-associated protein [Algibacter sp. L4_22]MCL5129298.1 HPF/RaiA family ribosome-associated protein [Algibacter sp. L4_22]